MSITPLLPPDGADAAGHDELLTGESDLASLSPEQLLAVAGAAMNDAEAGVLAGLGQLAAIDRLASWLAARKLTLVAGLSPFQDCEDAGWCEQNSFLEDVMVACRIGEGSARRLVDTALLARPGAPFAPMRRALAAGEVFEGHLRMLMSGTTNVVNDPTPVDPDASPGRDRAQKLTDICLRVLERAGTETVGKFIDTVAMAVCAVDGEAEAARRAAAADTRDVFVTRTDPDGMGALTARNTAHTLTGVKAEIDRRARALQLERGGATAARTDPDARIGACRADVLTAAILGTASPDSQEPAARPIVAHLVIDLPTLRRERDHPCTLDGVPIPAETGRDLAGQAGAWRRMVVAPVTGHLLDYGRKTYLPEPLTKFIRARDGVCPAPYCTRPSTRCEVDHRVPWETVGPSTTWNCGLFCDRHHPLKTDGHITVTNSRPDGSFDYRTRWGQSLHIPPRPYLDDPGRFHPHRDETIARETDPLPDPDPPPGTDPPSRLRLVPDTIRAAPPLPYDDNDPPF